jgi:hypothetical protein
MFCKQKGDSWSHPEKFPNQVNSDQYECGSSMALDHSMYFASQRTGTKGACDIFYSKFQDGQYQTPINQGKFNTPGSECGVYISPNQEFVIFTSYGRPEGYGIVDLYISFPLKDGSWATPQNMGAMINTADSEWPLSLSPDGKYFFFSRYSASSGITKIYWVDSKILVDQKKAVFAPKLKKQIPVMVLKTDTTLNYVIPANTFSCEYGIETLKFTVTSGNGSALPSWLSFNADTKTLSGTPKVPETDTIKISVTNADTVSASCTFKIRVSSRAAVNQFDEKEIKIYPNPTKGQFTISFGTIPIQTALIELRDLQGKLVLSKTINNSSNASIDLSGFSKGMYLVNVIAGGEIYKNKICVK